MRVNKQKGVALIQVLIITMIIMLLMVYFLTVAKTQVGRAQQLQDKTQAYLSYYSTKNAVLFRMLTSDYEQLRAEGWNFHGRPFKSNDDAQVSIQDLNGLLSLATTSGPERLTALLAPKIGGGAAEQIAQSFVDWIDSNNVAYPLGAEQDYYSPLGITVRNGPVQSFTELPLIRGMTFEAEQVFIKNTTVHPTRFFNPMVAPKDILQAYLINPESADSVIQMRGDSSYSRAAVIEATGLSTEDGLDYLNGPNFRIVINSQVGESFFGKTIEYGLYPYRPRPLVILSRLPRQQISR